ncbi:AFG1_ATPase domain-containing protein [Cephalotus follicularis]|uniref:AFG1_ATPase domain-containing protein n=1 Tax=Cephalotus follicularis TaxID=3775 RepID=A0A1Q3D7F8_CEPFO|nr:AFG1_ATPase domain-containing protein [Cephalotus follicularis]
MYPSTNKMITRSSYTKKSWLLSAPFLCKRASNAFNINMITKKNINVVRCYCPSLSQSKPPPGPIAHYRNLVEQGRLRHDPYQEKVALALEKLLGRLEQYEKDMEEYHVNLAKWEKNRENERRKLLMEEAELRQKGDMWTSVNKQRSRLAERWMFRKNTENVEPGVGKWVSYLNREKKLDSLFGRPPTAPPAPKGLYIYGNVGSGKTMLMDMFYGATQGIIKHRRRFHFHEAMLKINEDMHYLWKNQVEEKSLQSSLSSWIKNLPFEMKIKEWLAAEETYKQEVQMKNILPAVADKLLVDCQADQRGASILCFDEIQTVDVFAIVALSGILSRLLSTGTVLVSTSNRAPKDLNQDGMQREIFLKFLSKLEDHCEIIPIGNEIDYRRFMAESCIDQVHYFWPSDSSSVSEFEKMWCQVTKQLGGRITSNTISVMFGRTLEVPQSCNGVARFAFEYLCGRPVGAADYIAVAKNYHTVFISDIPVMSMRIRDKARRFITLIDELYNHHCCLFCSAASSIDDLFQGTEEGTLFDLESFQFETETEGSKLRRNVLAEGNVSSGGAPSGIVSMLSGQEEMFAFHRAVSRLIEMQTPLYLEGVRLLHPYFERQCQESGGNHALQS